MEYEVVDNWDDGCGVGVGGWNDEGGGWLWFCCEIWVVLRVVWEYWWLLVVSVDMFEDSCGWSVENVLDRCGFFDLGVLRFIWVCLRWDWFLLEDSCELCVCCMLDNLFCVDIVLDVVLMFWFLWFDVLVCILEDVGVSDVLLGVGFRGCEMWGGRWVWFVVVVVILKILGEEFYCGFLKRFLVVIEELLEVVEVWLFNDWWLLIFGLLFICNNLIVCDFLGDFLMEVVGKEDIWGEVVEWVVIFLFVLLEDW